MQANITGKTSQEKAAAQQERQRAMFNTNRRGRSLVHLQRQRGHVLSKIVSRRGGDVHVFWTKGGVKTAVVLALRGQKMDAKKSGNKPSLRAEELLPGCRGEAIPAAPGGGAS